MLPISFHNALRNSLKWFLGFVVLSIPWELFKDRAANWANIKIDQHSGAVMGQVASIIREIAIAPLGYTVTAVIVIFGLVFLHAYRKENSITRSAITSAQQKEQTENPSPFATFIEECKVCDPSYTELSKKLEVFIPRAFFCIEKMRLERNKYSFSILLEVAASYGWIGGIYNAELLFVINCLDRINYIDMELIKGKETIYASSTMGLMEPADKSIKFRQKYLDTFGNTTFHVEK